MFQKMFGKVGRDDKVFILGAIPFICGVTWAAIAHNEILSILLWLAGMVAAGLYSKRRGLI